MLLSGAVEATTKHAASRLRAAAEQAPAGFTIGWAVRLPGESLEATINRADKDLYMVRTAARSLQPAQ
jgi:hypothetical protein